VASKRFEHTRDKEEEYGSDDKAAVPKHNSEEIYRLEFY
jgi:hypothetical protein